MRDPVKYFCNFTKLRVVSGLVFVFTLGAVAFEYVALRYFSGLKSISGVFTVFVGILVFLFLSSMRMMTRVEIISILSFLILVISFGPFYGNSNALNPVAILMGSKIVAFYLMARFVFKYELGNVVALGSWFFFVISYFFYAYKTGDYFAYGYFETASFNLISSFVLVLSACVVVLYRDYDVLSFFVLLAAVTVCFILYARSSILVSLLLFFWWAVFRLNFKYVFVFFGFLLLISPYLQVLFFDLYAQSKFSKAGLDSPRWEMWGAYMSSLDCLGILFGLDLQFVDIIRGYNENPHNTFIKFHSTFGVFLFLFLFFYLAVSMSRVGLFGAGVLLLIFARASSDVIMLPGILDFYVFLIIFYGGVRVRNGNLKGAGGFGY